MSCFDKIPSYLVEYYRITENTPYETGVAEAASLLDVNRFDQGAKLYYIRSQETGRNTLLAQALYDKHIEAFQDGIVQEAGNADKKGMYCYHKAFDHLIQVFRDGNFDPDREWIPVDRKGQIMDGAHRLACAVYFGAKLKVIRFPGIDGWKYDYGFFRKRGLEEGYLRLMAAEISFFRKDSRLLAMTAPKGVCCQSLLEKEHGMGWQLLYGEKARKDMSKGNVNELENGRTYFSGGNKYLCIAVTGKSRPPEARNLEYDKIRKLFGLESVERKQEITVTERERKRCRRIRWVRYRYTRLIIGLKKLLGRPV